MYGVGLGALLGLSGAGRTEPTGGGGLAPTRSPEPTVHGDEVDWYRTVGGDLTDRFRDLAAIDDGGVTTVGITAPGGDGLEAGQYHWTDEGGLAWAAHHGDAGPDGAAAVTRSDDGCYVLCGLSAGGKTDRIYAVETDDRGEERWTNRFHVDGDEDDRGTDIVRTAEGGYAVAAASGDAAALAELGPGGAVRWTQQFEGGRWAEAVSVVETDDGYVLGGTVADGEGRDLLLLGTGPEGGERWRRTYSVGENDRLAQCIGADGGYLLAGTTIDEGAFTADALLVRTDCDGDVVWERTYGEEGEEYTAAGVTAIDGGYAFVGTRSVDVIGPEVLIGRLDDGGERTEEYTFGTARPEAPRAVTITDEGLIAVCGFRDPPGLEDDADGFVAVVRPE